MIFCTYPRKFLNYLLTKHDCLLQVYNYSFILHSHSCLWHIRGAAIKKQDWIFFRFPVNLATAGGVWYWLVLSPPFTVTISRSCGKQFGSSLCLKWIVFLFSAGIVLSVNVEQRVNVKFCVKLGKSATETCDMLKKFVVMSVYLVLKSSSGLKGLKREGKRSETISATIVPAHQKQTLTSKKVGEIIRQNRSLSIRAVAELINIDKETVRQILHNNFNLKKVCSKMCRDTTLLNKRKFEWTFVLTFFKTLKTTHTFRERNNLWWTMVFSIRPRK